MIVMSNVMTLEVWSVIIVVFCLIFITQCTSDSSIQIDPKYQLVLEAYNEAKKLFTLSLNNYDKLKAMALHAIDTFLDLVHILNEEMSKEIRSAIIKFYKIKYFQDFTNYVITIEDIIDITEHCLLNPVDKLEEIREQFHGVIKNFRDIRHFDTVDKCLHELPDEVAVAHCVIHQAVLFNETMQESLTKIVEIKTRQHAQDINTTLYEVKRCFKDFVPNFYEQLLVGSYTESCKFLRIVNASTSDLVNDKWRHTNETKFPKKWSPVVGLLKEKKQRLGIIYKDTGTFLWRYWRPLNVLRQATEGVSAKNHISRRHHMIYPGYKKNMYHFRSKFPQQSLQEPIFLTLFAANFSSQDIVKSLFSNN